MRRAVSALAALMVMASNASLAQSTSTGTAVSVAGTGWVTKVQMKLVAHDRPPELLSGWLWRHPLSGEIRRVARVDTSGALDQPYACGPGDRLVGKPDRYVSTRSESQPCREGVEFEFSAVRTVRLEEAPSGSTIAVESYLTAYSDIGVINHQAASLAYGNTRLKHLAKSQAAQTAMIWASARALGDNELETLVTLDPSQGYRLVLSKEGVMKIEQLQRSNKLPVTGQLDFATLDLIGKMTSRDALKERDDKLFVLPSDFFRDKAVLGSPNKSAGLVELTRAARGGN